MVNPEALHNNTGAATFFSTRLESQRNKNTFWLIYRVLCRWSTSGLDGRYKHTLYILLNDWRGILKNSNVNKN